MYMAIYIQLRLNNIYTRLHDQIIAIVAIVLPVWMYNNVFHNKALASNS